MAITLLHDEVCEECKQLSRRVAVLHGFHRLEDIAVCKQCIVNAYDMIRQDEAKEIEKGMRPF